MRALCVGTTPPREAFPPGHGTLGGRDPRVKAPWEAFPPNQGTLGWRFRRYSAPWDGVSADTGDLDWRFLQTNAPRVTFPLEQRTSCGVSSEPRHLGTARLPKQRTFGWCFLAAKAFQCGVFSAALESRASFTGRNLQCEATKGSNVHFGDLSLVGGAIDGTE